MTDHLLEYKINQKFKELAKAKDQRDSLIKKYKRDPIPEKGFKAAQKCQFIAELTEDLQHLFEMKA